MQDRPATPVATEIALTGPAWPEARTCLAAYHAELARRFATGFDVSLSRDPEADVFLDKALRAPETGRAAGGRPAPAVISCRKATQAGALPWTRTGNRKPTGPLRPA